MFKKSIATLLIYTQILNVTMSSLALGAEGDEPGQKPKQEDAKPVEPPETAQARRDRLAREQWEMGTWSDDGGLEDRVDKMVLESELSFSEYMDPARRAKALEKLAEIEAKNQDTVEKWVMKKSKKPPGLFKKIGGIALKATVGGAHFMLGQAVHNWYVSRFVTRDPVMAAVQSDASSFLGSLGSIAEFGMAASVTEMSLHYTVDKALAYKPKTLIGKTARVAYYVPVRVIKPLASQIGMMSGVLTQSFIDKEIHNEGWVYLMKKKHEAWFRQWASLANDYAYTERELIANDMKLATIHMNHLGIGTMALSALGPQKAIEDDSQNLLKQRAETKKKLEEYRSEYAEALDKVYKATFENNEAELLGYMHSMSRMVLATLGVQVVNMIFGLMRFGVSKAANGTSHVFWKSTLDPHTEKLMKMAGPAELHTLKETQTQLEAAANVLLNMKNPPKAFVKGIQKQQDRILRERVGAFRKVFLNRVKTLLLSGVEWTVPTMYKMTEDIAHKVRWSKAWPWGMYANKVLAMEEPALQEWALKICFKALRGSVKEIPGFVIGGIGAFEFLEIQRRVDDFLNEIHYASPINATVTIPDLNVTLFGRTYNVLLEKKFDLLGITSLRERTDEIKKSMRANLTQYLTGKYERPFFIAQFMDDLARYRALWEDYRSTVILHEFTQHYQAWMQYIGKGDAQLARDQRYLSWMARGSREDDPDFLYNGDKAYYAAHQADFDDPKSVLKYVEKGLVWHEDKKKFPRAFAEEYASYMKKVTESTAFPWKQDKAHPNKPSHTKLLTPEYIAVHMGVQRTEARKEHVSRVRQYLAKIRPILKNAALTNQAPSYVEMVGINEKYIPYNLRDSYLAEWAELRNITLGLQDLIVDMNDPNASPSVKAFFGLLQESKKHAVSGGVEVKESQKMTPCVSAYQKQTDGLSLVQLRALQKQGATPGEQPIACDLLEYKEIPGFVDYPEVKKFMELFTTMKGIAIQREVDNQRTPRQRAGMATYVLGRALYAIAADKYSMHEWLNKRLNFQEPAEAMSVKMEVAFEDNLEQSAPLAPPVVGGPGCSTLLQSTQEPSKKVCIIPGLRADGTRVDNEGNEHISAEDQAEMEDQVDTEPAAPPAAPPPPGGH